MESYRPVMYFNACSKSEVENPVNRVPPHALDGQHQASGHGKIRSTKPLTSGPSKNTKPNRGQTGCCQHDDDGGRFDGAWALDVHPSQVNPDERREQESSVKQEKSLNALSIRGFAWPMKRGHLVFSPSEKEAMEHHQITRSRNKHPRNDERLHALRDFTPVDEGVVKSSNTPTEIKNIDTNVESKNGNICCRRWKVAIGYH